MTPLHRSFPTLALLTLAAVATPVVAAWYDLPAGGASFKLLKLDASPRSLALSGAGAGAGGDDAIANSATDSLSHTSLSVGYGQTFSRLEGSLQQAGWALPVGDWTCNALARFSGFENLPGRDEDANSTGTYSASSWTLDAGLSAPLPLAGLRAGASIGVGMDAISDATSWASWMSLGLAFKKPEASWSAGIAVRNLGIATQSGAKPQRLPVTLQAGAAWHQALGSWTLTPMADIKFVADEDIQFPVALEVRWNVLSIRTGFVVGPDEFLPSAGAGLEWDAWFLDVGTGWHQALGFAPAARLGVRI